MEKSICVDSPVGRLCVTERDGCIVRLSFGECSGNAEETELLREAARL